MLAALKKYLRDRNNLKKFILFLLLAAGAVFMLRDFFSFRSLWLDEAALALNLSRGFKDFAEPLGYGQIAPLFFLYTTKIFTLVFGLKDWVLRIIPLLAGLGSVAIFFLILSKSFSLLTSIFSLSVYILSNRIIYYATEFKQYSTDIFFSLVLVYIYLKISDSEVDANKTILLTLTGIIAMWFSYASIIVLAAIAIMLVLKIIMKKKRRKIIEFIVFSMIIAINLILVYFLYYKRVTTGVQELGSYWGFGFMPFPPTSPQDFLWPFKSILDLIYFTYKIDGGLFSGILPVLKTIFAFLILALFIFGIIKTIRKQKNIFLITIIILLISLALSAMRIYPFSERTVIFTAPFIVLFVGEGLSHLYISFKKIHITIPVIILFLFFILPFSIRIYYLIEPPYKSEIKPVIDYYNEHRQDGDLLYLENYYIHQFRFYLSEGRIDFQDAGDLEVATPEAVRGKRVWVIGDIGELKDRGVAIEQYMVETLSSRIAERIPIKRLSERITEFNDPGVEITLYDF